MREEDTFMKLDEIKLSVQKVIQTLGAPIMNYSPTHANLEREIMIDKAVGLLFRLLRELEDNHGSRSGD
jgi:hypothetical protein